MKSSPPDVGDKHRFYYKEKKKVVTNRMASTPPHFSNPLAGKQAHLAVSSFWFISPVCSITAGFSNCITPTTPYCDFIPAVSISGVTRSRSQYSYSSGMGNAASPLSQKSVNRRRYRWTMGSRRSKMPSAEWTLPGLRLAPRKSPSLVKANKGWNQVVPK